MSSNKLYDDAALATLQTVEELNSATTTMTNAAVRLELASNRLNSREVARCLVKTTTIRVLMFLMIALVLAISANAYLLSKHITSTDLVFLGERSGADGRVYELYKLPPGYDMCGGEVICSKK